MISSDEYAFIAALLHRNIGLALGAGKQYLLESRLPPVARTYGFASVSEMIGVLRSRPHRDLVRAVCEAMTTGETFFFRDSVPFDVLRTMVLPEVAERCRTTHRTPRIWCAAASTGQEPYSVAMMLEEASASFARGRFELVATDYASHVLNRARRGTFAELEVQRGLPEELLRKYFVQVQGGYRVVDEIRRRVVFRELNLIESFRSLGQFDVILCRNVLIYFDVSTKTDVLERLSAALAPGGYLFLGASESTFGLTDRLVRVSELATSVHVRREDIDVVRARLRKTGPVTPAA